MRQDSFSAFHYQIGGSLPSNAPTYVVRQADRDILDTLLAGEYCYVLNARQMGKSSLRVRTMNQLDARGIACTEIELSGIGSQQITAQQWYGGIVQEIIDGFELQVDRRSWWRETEDLSPVQRLATFIDKILLQQIDRDIVIFIDEIDSILSLNFPTDDFLTLIHNFYNKRANKPEYRRLTFALLGVATPRELIRDRHATPFNIGRSLELKGLQLSESFSLARGFSDRQDRASTLIARVLFWTGGQPFLTQKLCRLIEQNPQVKDIDSLDRLVRTKIIYNWESHDDPEHLRTIRDRLCRYSNGNLTNSSQKLLNIYRQIRTKGKVKLRNCQEHLELQLSGLVVADQGNLVVKNPIYQAIFDRIWVERQLKNLDEDEGELSLKKIIFASLAIASSVVGIRYLGWLEMGELKFFDLMMSLRPAELADERLFIVKVTEEDVRSQPAIERGGASISDRSLAKLLAKLERSPARAVGLDIYRETPLKKAYQAQIAPVRQSDRFIAICKYGDPGIKSSSQIVRQDGFNNVALDADSVIRRQILAVDSAAPCNSFYSFNWTLATHYLKEVGISRINSPKYLQLGKSIFKPIGKNTGGYRQLNNSGHQIIFNCRNTNKIAESATLQEVFSDRFDLNLVKDRLVLIGTEDPSFNDRRWRTPCHDQQSGIEVQAQMIGQILSYVLDGRALIRSLSEPVESLIIICFSVAGGIFCHRFSSTKKIIGIAVVVVSNFGLSQILLITFGVWMPVVPSVIGFTIVITSLTIYRQYWQK